MIKGFEIIPSGKFKKEKGKWRYLAMNKNADKVPHGAGGHEQTGLFAH